MNRPSRREILGAALLGLSGCALIATRPPTPAARLSPEELNTPETNCRYFVTVFAAESVPRAITRVHVFATVMRATCRDGVLTLLDHHTISWLPKTLQVRVLNFQPEPGYNFGLHKTIQWSLDSDHRVAQWGPYECEPALYRRFVVQKEYLESNAIAYQAVDTVGAVLWKGNAANCIHAITDMDPDFGRENYPLFRLGETASHWIVRQLWERGVLLSPDRVYSCLDEQLGLTQFPIVHRTYPG